MKVIFYGLFVKVSRRNAFTKRKTNKEIELYEKKRRSNFQL